jgi:hypothetical protein
VTFQDYWSNLVAKNPPLGHGDYQMSMPTHEFKRQLERAFRAGGSSSHGFGDLFGSFIDAAKKGSRQ